MSLRRLFNDLKGSVCWRKDNCISICFIKLFYAGQLIPLEYLVVILPNKCLRNIAHVNGLSSPMYFMNAPYRSLLTRLEALYINELIKLQLV